MKLPSWLMVLALLLAGCGSISTQVQTTGDMRQYHHVFVRTASNDSDNLDQVIVQELQRLGYDASAGQRTMMPDNAEIVIDYDPKWDWDFRTYLIQLTLTIRDAHTEASLGNGHIFHPGVTNKSPAEMVRLVIDPLFAPKGTKK